MTILKEAVRYSSMGWIVHPLTGPESGGASPGKRPIIKKWQYMSVPQNETQLKKWFENTTHNLGLVCGDKSNIMVIDIDHDHFKDDLLDGVMVDTLRSQRTKGRGHIFFKYTDELKSQKHHDMGFEVLSVGNNAVLPPSIHQHGDVYKWIDPDIDVAEFPTQLIKNINSLVEQKKRVASLVGKCRECFRTLYSKKQDVHGADGREMMIAFCTELKAKGAMIEDILFVAKIMYGSDFDAQKTELEFKNLDENKTWKCDTLAQKLPKYVSCATCNSNKKQKIITAVSQTNMPSVIEVAYSIHDNTPFIYDESKCFWLWTKNYYSRVDEIDMVSTILDQTGDVGYLNRSRKGTMLDAVRIVGRKTAVLPLPGKWIQFMNMAVDVDTMNEFQPEPSHFYTSPIPHNLSQSTDTPNIDQLFTDWVGEDQKQILYEVCAYCMLPSYPLHKMFWFLGTGRNGKGRFMALIRKLIGTRNTTSTDLERLADSRFESAKLFKRLVAFVGETDHNILKRTNLLKSLTGEDAIGAEFKNKEPFDFYNAAKILIATNSLPGIEDKTDGWYSRNIIIDFPNKFPEGKDIIGTIEEWEMENMCRKCVDIVHSLTQNGEFYGEGNVADKRTRYEEASDPIKMFMDLYCEESINNDIPMFVFRDAFIPFLEERGYRKMSDREITIKLRSEGYIVKPVFLFGKTTRCLQGISINSKNIPKTGLNIDTSVQSPTKCNDSGRPDQTQHYTNYTNSHSKTKGRECIGTSVIGVSSVSQVSQRDTIKHVINSIMATEQNGLSKATEAKSHALYAGVPPSDFEGCVAHLRASGAIMEPKEGYLKCI